MADALVPHAAARAQIERLQPQQPLAQGDAGRQMAAGAAEKIYFRALHFTTDLADVSDVEVCHVAAATEMQF